QSHGGSLKLPIILAESVVVREPCYHDSKFGTTSNIYVRNQVPTQRPTLRTVPQGGCLFPVGQYRGRSGDHLTVPDPSRGRCSPDWWSWLGQVDVGSSS